MPRLSSRRRAPATFRYPRAYTSQLRMEQLEDRLAPALGEWLAVFGGLPVGNDLLEQTQYGRNHLAAAGVPTTSVEVTGAVDLSGTLLLKTPFNVIQETHSLESLTMLLEGVPGFIFVQDYDSSEPTRLRYVNPKQVLSESINGEFDYVDFLRREKNGEIPNQSGPTGDSGLVNVLTNNNTGSSGTAFFTQSETTLVAFGNTVVVGFNDSGSNSGGSNKFTGFARSTDGGTTFVDGGTLPTNPNGDAGDPVMARHDGTGRIYYSTLAFSGSRIQMFRSDDNGVTWMAPVNAAPGSTGFQDKQWHTVDNFAGSGNGNVYHAVRDFGSSNSIRFYRSTDGGATFGPNAGVLIASGSPNNVQGPFVVVSPDHSVSVFYFDENSSPERIMMRRSTDQGVSFSAPVQVATLGTGPGFNGDLALTGRRNGLTTFSGFRSNAFPHAVVNPISGHMYVTYADNPAGSDKADVFLRMSTDNGATWSSALRVNDDIGTTDQWQPTLAVTPDGSKLGIFYYSRQEDPTDNNLFKYYGRIASISGSTLSFAPSFAISDVASLPEFGRDGAVNSVYMGDYDTAVATAGAFHVVWSDNRSALPGGGTRMDPNVFYKRIAVGLSVTTTTPAVGTTVTTVPLSYIVNFSDPINPASVQATDFTVDGVAANTFVINTPTQVTFNYTTPPFTAQGLHTMAMAAGSVTRTGDDNPLNAFSGTFRFDSVSLAVTTTVPPVGGVFSLPGPFTYDVNFNEAIAAASIGLDDLTLSLGTVTSAMALDADTARYTISGITTEVSLTITLAAGKVTDTSGNPNPGAFVGTYAVDIGTVPYPVPLAAKNPLGSLVYDPTISGIIGTPGDTDNFTISVDPNQRITVVLDPAATLQGMIRLFDGSNVLIGSASSAAAGLDAVIQTAPTSGGTQTYRIEVSGVGVTTGNYILGVVLNAREEAERHNGPTNDTFATAEDINGSFISAGTSSRGAVLGTAGGNDYYQFTANAGETITLALQSLSGGTVNVALFSPANVLLGTAVIGPTNVSRILPNLVAPTSGSYRALVTGTAGTTYNLVVLRNSAFDSEANNTFTAAQFIGASDGALGYISPAVGGTRNALDSGWINSLGEHSAFNNNYLTGLIGPSTVYRNYSVFSLAGVGSVTGAELRLFNPGGGFSSPDPTETFTVFDVSATPAQLDTNRGSGDPGGIAIHADLGSGTVFGSRVVSNADNNTTVVIPLNAAAVAAINAAIGGTIAFGGSITTIAGTANQFIFGFTSGGGTSVQLVLSTGGEEDWYSFAVNAGDSLNLSTITPADGSGQFVNTLNPKIELYNPSGALVASGVVLGDGRNEQISHTALATGLYRARVISEGGTVGEYFLSLAGNTGTQQPPFMVTATNPANGAQLRISPTTMTVDFNDAFLATSVQASDLQVDGINATAVSVVDGDTVVFTLAGPFGQGLHTVTIAGGSILDVQGTPINSYSGTFFIDTIAPRVTATNIAPNAVLPPGALSYQVTFSEAMRIPNLTTDDFSLRGNLRGVNYSASSFSFNAAGTVLTLNYVGLPDDDYSLTLVAGVSGGSNFTDVVGNALDGEFSGVFPSGNGVAGGNFVIGFDMDLVTEAFPAVAAKAPAGSLIYDGSLVRTVAFTGDTDSFTIALDAGQTITAIVNPGTAGLRPFVEVRAPGGALLGSHTAAAPGQAAHLQTLPAETAGIYTVVVGGAASTQGRYTVQVILNAAQETESLPGGGTNNTLATAQNINGSFRTLSTPAAAMQRGAALGTTDTGANYTATAVAYSFEDISGTGTRTMTEIDDSFTSISIPFAFNFYGTSFTTVFFSTNGLITFGSGTATFSNTSLASNPSQATIATFWSDLDTFDGGGVYWQVLGSPGSRRLIIQHEGHYLGDFDTISFQAVLFEGSNQIRFNYRDLVGDFAADGDFATVGVKRPNPTAGQFIDLCFNNGPNAFVGTGKSTLLTPPTGVTPDLYQFTLVAGETSTVAVTAQSGGNLNVDLLDAGGMVVASGIPAANLTKVISHYVSPTGGTYYARVSGDSNVQYSLVVTKSGTFDTESNNDAATAQNITGTHGVLGSAGSDPTGRLLAITGAGGAASTLFRLNPANGAVLQTIGATGMSHLTGIDVHPITGEIYAHNNNTAQLVRINPTTGVATVVGTTGARIPDMSFRPDGTLFAWVEFGAGGSDDLATINLSTGAVTIISSPISTFQTGIAFDSSGNLFVKAGNILYRVNPANGQIISSLGMTTSTSNVLEFSPGNVLYTATRSGGSAFVQTINITTGAVTTLGTSSGVPISGLAFASANDPDWYSVTLDEFQTALALETRTPADGPNQFVNTLNPKIDLFDSTGTTLIASGVALGDGRNERILATGLTPGETYLIRVTGEGSTSGEFFLGATALRVATPDSQTDDDNAAIPGKFGTTEGGGWTHVTGAGGYQGDYTLHPDNVNEGPNNFAIWEIDATSAFPELFVTWVARPTNATNATYLIFDQAFSLLGTVVIDQTKPANDVLLFGTTFAESLGAYSLTDWQPGSLLYVILTTEGANGDLVADAVFDPPAPLPAPVADELSDESLVWAEPIDEVTEADVSKEPIVGDPIFGLAPELATLPALDEMFWSEDNNTPAPEPTPMPGLLRLINNHKYDGSEQVVQLLDTELVDPIWVDWDPVLKLKGTRM